jgi:hypothetical protein
MTKTMASQKFTWTNTTTGLSRSAGRSPTWEIIGSSRLVNCPHHLTCISNSRRIMPCPHDKDRYQRFHVQQNQLSVYSETAASKRREECAKQQRIELEEKFKHNQHILKQFRFSKNYTGEDDVVKKKKAKKNKRNFFKPDDVGDSEERERCSSMGQREYLVKSVGLLQAVRRLSTLC